MKTTADRLAGFLLDSRSLSESFFFRCRRNSKYYTIYSQLWVLHPTVMKMWLIFRVSSGFEKQFFFGHGPQQLMNEDIKSYLSIPIGGGKKKMYHTSAEREKARATPFVLHNELSQYYSLSDDWTLAPAPAGRKRQWSLEELIYHRAAAYSRAECYWGGGRTAKVLQSNHARFHRNCHDQCVRGGEVSGLKVCLYTSGTKKCLCKTCAYSFKNPTWRN